MFSYLVVGRQSCRRRLQRCRRGRRLSLPIQSPATKEIPDGNEIVILGGGTGDTVMANRLRKLNSPARAEIRVVDNG